MMKVVRATLVLKGDRTVGRYFGDDKLIPGVFLHRAEEQSEVM